MSQLVACRSERGLVLAADRRVVVEAGGESRIHSVQKVFALGPTAAVATSGAAVGVAVSRTLARLFRKRAALPFTELEDYVLNVFQKTYDEFVEQGARWFEAHPGAHQLSYILLGGRESPGTFAFRFHASEAHGKPYLPLPTGAVLSAPRRLGLEGRLARALAAGAGLDELRRVTVEGLRLIAAKEESVAPPFDVAVIDDHGARLTSDGCDTPSAPESAREVGFGAGRKE